MKVIVTGFDAFGTHESNPSQEAVAELPEFIKFKNGTADLRVAKLTLPTCCSDAWDTLSREVEAGAGSPYAVLMSGLADSRDKICLERFALNVRQFRMPDNRGHQWDDEQIHNDAPDALRTRIQLKDLYEHLNQKGYAVDISNYAGTFVCNETYYRSLFRWQEDPQCRGILFVHVPPFESYRHTNPEHVDERHPKRVYADALAEIALFLMSS
jgi:pyroglutamyl-peptidase